MLGGGVGVAEAQATKEDRKAGGLENQNKQLTPIV